jgi:uncharacterized protein
MVTQQLALDLAREFVQAVVNKGVRLEKAFLFGSFARNEQKKDSDIDIALVADDFTGIGYFDLRHFLDVKISSTKYTPIEAHTFNSTYFRAGDPFVREIERTGILLL